MPKKSARGRDASRKQNGIQPDRPVAGRGKRGRPSPDKPPRGGRRRPWDKGHPDEAPLPASEEEAIRLLGYDPATGAKLNSKRPANAFPPGNPWRFPRGVSGNPQGGRAVNRIMSAAYLALLQGVNEDGVSNAELLAEVRFQAALEGDGDAAKEIRRATEGDVVKMQFGNMTESELLKFIQEKQAVIAALQAGEEPAERPPSAPNGQH